MVKEMRATPPVLPKALRPGRRLSSPVTRLLSIGPPPEVLHVVLRGSGRTGGRCSRDTSNRVSPRGSVRIWSTPRRVTSTMCQKGDSTALSLSLPPCSWIALWFSLRPRLPGIAGNSREPSSGQPEFGYHPSSKHPKLLREQLCTGSPPCRLPHGPEPCAYPQKRKSASIPMTPSERSRPGFSPPGAPSGRTTTSATLWSRATSPGSRTKCAAA